MERFVPLWEFDEIYLYLGSEIAKTKGQAQIIRPQKLTNRNRSKRDN